MDTQGRNDWIGRTLGGRYQILEVIGEGGMGVVYRALQISVDREVAIKMMHVQAVPDTQSTQASQRASQWVQRFQREAKACSQLTHPNTVRLYDFGQTTRGNFYMVMELLVGRSLTDLINAEAPLAPARVLRILMQSCASLSEAHRAGIVHRDIKPDNMFLLALDGTSDFIKLFDFSIAKLENIDFTAAGVLIGTPQFMSPEQGRGESIDARSDIYSLGIVAHTMLAGRLPFNSEDPIAVLKMHQDMAAPPLPASIPSSVSKLVISCIEKDPADRPSTALELLEAAQVWLSDLEPGLDLYQDSILRNTLVMDEAASEPPTFQRVPTDAKTILTASGSSSKRLREASEQARPNTSVPTEIYGSGVAQLVQANEREQSPEPAKPTPEPRSPKPAREKPKKESATNHAPVTHQRHLEASLPQGDHVPEPLPQRFDTTTFFAICVLVAMSFGFGGYYLTITLR